MVVIKLFVMYNMVRILIMSSIEWGPFIIIDGVLSKSAMLESNKRSVVLTNSSQSVS